MQHATHNRDNEPRRNQPHQKEELSQQPTQVNVVIRKGKRKEQKKRKKDKVENAGCQRKLNEKIREENEK